MSKKRNSSQRGTGIRVPKTPHDGWGVFALHGIVESKRDSLERIGLGRLEPFIDSAHPFTHKTCFKVCTISTKSFWFSMT